MKNRRMRKAITKNLTPKEAWDLYAGSSPPRCLYQISMQKVILLQI